MMAAALLHKGLTVLTNVPRIQDTACMMKILEALGCSCIRRGCSVFIDAGEIKKTQVPQEYVRSMRSSIILLGALLGRMGQGNCCYPGGCLIGARPIDLHLMALNKMGAVIREEDGIIEACAGKDGGCFFLSQRGGYGAGSFGCCARRGSNDHPRCCHGTGNQPAVRLP